MIQKVGKWNFIVFVVFFILLIFVAYKVSKTPKIAYIDTNKLLSGVKEMQILQEQLKRERAIAKLKIDTLTTEFETALKAHEKELAQMTSKEKKLSEELLQNKQNQLVQYQQAINQKLQQQEQEKMGEVMKQVNSHIAEYGKKKGYTIILATANGNIAYADDAIDVTADVIKEMSSN